MTSASIKVSTKPTDSLGQTVEGLLVPLCKGLEQRYEVVVLAHTVDLNHPEPTYKASYKCSLFFKEKAYTLGEWSRAWFRRTRFAVGAPAQQRLCAYSLGQTIR